MSDGAVSAAPPVQPAAEGPSAGTLLRRAREAAGLHVAALAVSLKVPVRKLEALEEDRWDLLPDAVFVRALASSVCRTLKVDPQPILDRLPQSAAPRLVQDDEGINRPFRAPSDGAPMAWYSHLNRPVVLAVLGLLLAALVLILLPTVPRLDGVVATGGEGQTTTTVAPLPAMPAAPEAAPAQDTPAQAAASGTAPPTAAPASSAAAPQAAVAVLPGASGAGPQPAATVALATPARPAASEAAASAPGAGASGILVFRTKGPSWVEVTDAKGVVALRKLLAAGETAGVSGTPPLRVTIGRVDSTEVQVRGKPYDLGPVSQDNVARFEVK